MCLNWVRLQINHKNRWQVKYLALAIFKYSENNQNLMTYKYFSPLKRTFANH